MRCIRRTGLHRIAVGVSEAKPAAYRKLFGGIDNGRAMANEMRGNIMLLYYSVLVHDIILVAVTRQ